MYDNTWNYWKLITLVQLITCKSKGNTLFDVDIEINIRIINYSGDVTEKLHDSADPLFHGF